MMILILLTNNFIIMNINCLFPSRWLWKCIDIMLLIRRHISLSHSLFVLMEIKLLPRPTVKLDIERFNGLTTINTNHNTNYLYSGNEMYPILTVKLFQKYFWIILILLIRSKKHVNFFSTLDELNFFAMFFHKFGHWLIKFGHCHVNEVLYSNPYLHVALVLIAFLTWRFFSYIWHIFYTFLNYVDIYELDSDIWRKVSAPL